MAHHLLVHSSLLKDHSYTKKLTPSELMQSTSVAWASILAFLSELMQRYTNMLENQAPAELQDRVYALELKLKLAEEERKLAEEKKTQLRKERLAEIEQSKATVNSLKSALEEEKKRRLQEEQSTQAAINKAGSSAVEAFRSSETFTHDLGQLTLPNYMFGYTTAIKEVTPFLTTEQVDLFKDKASYNEDA